MKDTGKKFKGLPLYDDPDVPSNTLYFLNNDFMPAPPRRGGKLTMIDTNNFTGDFEVIVDVDKSGPIAMTVLSFPNETQVTISGDTDIIRQIVNRLDGLTIQYIPSNLKDKE